MSEKRLKKDSTNKDSVWTSEARWAVLGGFFLRLLMLILIIYVVDWDIYYLEDDKKFEELAGKYLFNANGLVDTELLKTLTVGWVSPFWAYVLCISSKLFGSVFAPRYINIILSTLCIAAIYKLCYEITENQKTALTAARLFAFLPFPILVCCFPIKDIFIMVSVTYAFYLFVRIQNDRKVSVGSILLCTVLLSCVYFTRGAVTELLLIFLTIYYLQKLYRQKRYLAALLLLMGALAIFFLFRNSIMAVFEEKVDTYGNYYADEANGLNAIRVTGITDIYKLPLAYAFSMLQPLKFELFNVGNDVRPWRTVMSYTNITMFPVGVGAWLYMFVKKHNLFFWLSTFAMFSAVIMLSLGVSRHYLFLFPIHLINYSLYMEETHENHKNRRTLVFLGTFAFFVLIFCYSLVKLL